MQVQVYRNHLLEALQTVVGIVEKNQIEPIYEKVLLQVDGDRLNLATSDTEIEVHTETFLNSSSELYRCAVPARKLFDLVRSLPDGANLTLDLQANEVLVQYLSSEYKLLTLSPELFHTINLDEPKLIFSLSQKQLGNLLKSSQFSISLRDSREYLCGMLFEIVDDNLFVVASDGNRISVGTTDIQLESAGAGVKQAILPRKAVLELGKVINDVIDPMSIQLFNNALVFDFHKTRFVAKVLEKQYPNYQRIFPDAYGITLDVDVQLLISSLKRVAILSSDSVNDKVRKVEIGLHQNLLRIRSLGQQDKALEEIEVSYDGVDVERIGFNIDYLLDVLNSLESANATMQLSDDLKCYIEDSKDGVRIQHLVMPIKL